jgi:hypothetical protein
MARQRLPKPSLGVEASISVGVLVLDPSATLRYVVGQVLCKRLFDITVRHDFEAADPSHEGPGE